MRAREPFKIQTVMLTELHDQHARQGPHIGVVACNESNQSGGHCVVLLGLHAEVLSLNQQL